MWGLSAVNSRTWNGSSGWYVPSINEWAAFAGQLNIMNDKLLSDGLSNEYWSSSQFNKYTALAARFAYDNIFNYGVTNLVRVRLGTTF